MEIIIEPHTLERASERGVSEEEIRLVIKQGNELIAKKERLAKFLIIPFKQNRGNKYYEQKRIEVYYIVENNRIITVTVYAFYGKWEENL